MKRLPLILAAVLLLAASASGREFAVSGPQGGLAMKVSLPKGFDTAKDSCHIVILMHGIFSSKDYPPMPNIARALAKESLILIAPGPVCIIHGSNDGTVPLWCSEKYDAIYANSEMHIVEGENHLIIRKRPEVIAIILDFLRRTLKI